MHCYFLQSKRRASIETPIIAAVLNNETEGLRPKTELAGKNASTGSDIPYSLFESGQMDKYMNPPNPCRSKKGEHCSESLLFTRRDQNRQSFGEGQNDSGIEDEKSFSNSNNNNGSGQPVFGKVYTRDTKVTEYDYENEVPSGGHHNVDQKENVSFICLFVCLSVLSVCLSYLGSTFFTIIKMKLQTFLICSPNICATKLPP